MHELNARCHLLRCRDCHAKWYESSLHLRGMMEWALLMSDGPRLT